MMAIVFLSVFYICRCQLFLHPQIGDIESEVQYLIKKAKIKKAELDRAKAKAEADAAKEEASRKKAERKAKKKREKEAANGTEVPEGEKVEEGAEVPITEVPAAGRRADVGKCFVGLAEYGDLSFGLRSVAVAFCDSFSRQDISWNMN